MKLKDFFKDKLLSIFLLIFCLITVETFLIIYPIGNFIKIYVPIVVIFTYLLGITFEYIKKRNFYNNFISKLDKLEEKYLIAEILKSPNFIEGKILFESLHEIDKSMIEKINQYKYLQEDYKDYIEMWIHEIKLPIATSKMIIENNKNEITVSIDEELDKIENYIEQALYYARSNTVEKDYYIKKIILKDIVNDSIKKNKKALIQQKVEINTHDLDTQVNTDFKWIIFIINQIIQNSIKYKREENNLNIEFCAKEQKEKVILSIKDNGIGIKENELSRIFKKGFTGTNGRKNNKKSTGIGLYLCKKLCDKLGIGIEVYSKENEGTETKIIFPKNSYYELEEK